MRYRRRGSLGNRREDGFTLIELLVVIIIIGILAAIAIPIFLHQKGKAQDGAATSDLRSLAEQEELYLNEQQTTARLRLCGLPARTSGFLPGSRSAWWSTTTTVRSACHHTTSQPVRPSTGTASVVGSNQLVPLAVRSQRLVRLATR